LTAYSGLFHITAAAANTVSRTETPPSRFCAPPTLGPRFHRALKLARTIADLAGSDTITALRMAEALQYRARGDLG